MLSGGSTELINISIFLESELEYLHGSNVPDPNHESIIENTLNRYRNNSSETSQECCRSSTMMTMLKMMNSIKL
jgi:hypothetical protein